MFVCESCKCDTDDLHHFQGIYVCPWCVLNMPMRTTEPPFDWVVFWLCLGGMLFVLLLFFA